MLGAAALSAAVRALSEGNADTPRGAGEPGLLERAKSLLEGAPLIDTHNLLPSLLLESSAGDLCRPLPFFVRRIVAARLFG